MGAVSWLRQYDSAESAIIAAAFQRPGVKIAVGHTRGEDRLIEPLPYRDLAALQGAWSWLGYDLGHDPSLWAVSFGAVLNWITGRPMVETVPVFEAPGISLTAARAILAAAVGRVQKEKA